LSNDESETINTMDPVQMKWRGVSGTKNLNR
jgi:hypothetical protein